MADDLNDKTLYSSVIADNVHRRLSATNNDKTR